MPISLASAALALGMFSRIPMPAMELAGAPMRWALAWWPLVGVVQGLVVLAWGLLAGALRLPALLAGAVLALLPLLVNGGIHMDGLADASDALASHAPRQRALAIMSDPQVGSFAVLTLIVHVVLAVACAASARWAPGLLGALGCTYVLSRALAGYAVARWPQAREGGLSHAFASAAAPRAHVVLAGEALLAAGAIVALALWRGVLCCAVAVLVLACYRRMCRVRFGGVTGDTSGWLVQTCELACLAALTLGSLLA